MDSDPLDMRTILAQVTFLIMCSPFIRAFARCILPLVFAWHLSLSAHATDSRLPSHTNLLLHPHIPIPRRNRIAHVHAAFVVRCRIPASFVVVFAFVSQCTPLVSICSVLASMPRCTCLSTAHVDVHDKLMQGFSGQGTHPYLNVSCRLPLRRHSFIDVG